MTDTTISDAVVFCQDEGVGVPDGSEDYNSAAGFQLLSKYKGDGTYVGETEAGAPTLQFNDIDTTNETVDVGTGYAFIMESGHTIQSGSQTTYDTTIPVSTPYTVILPTEVTSLGLGTDTDNDVWLAVDPSSNDNVYIRHGSGLSAPTDPSVKLGTVNSSTGATTRPNDLASTTLQSLSTISATTKDKPVIDVTHPEFGAVGDGSTDDTAAVQDAADRAISLGGATIYFPPGDYVITRQTGEDVGVLVNDTTTGVIEIMGPGATLLNNCSESSAGRGCALFGYNGAGSESGLIIHPIQVDGSGGGGNNDVLYADPAAAKLEVQPGDWTNNRHGVVTIDPAGGTVDDVTAPDISIHGPGNIQDNSGVGIILVNGAGIEVRRLRIKDNADRAVEIGQDGSRSILGTSIVGAPEVTTVQNCTIERNHGGIWADSDTAHVLTSSFESNDEGDSGRAHVNLEKAAPASSAKGNKFSGGHNNIIASGWMHIEDNRHQNGDVCLINNSDQPVYAPTEWYSGITTKFGGSGAGFITSPSASTVSLSGRTVTSGSMVQLGGIFTVDSQRVVTMDAGVRDASGDATNLNIQIRNITTGENVFNFVNESSYDYAEKQPSGDGSIYEYNYIFGPGDDANYSSGDEYSFVAINNRGSDVELSGFVTYQFSHTS